MQIWKQSNYSSKNWKMFEQTDIYLTENHLPLNADKTEVIFFYKSYKLGSRV